MLNERIKQLRLAAGISQVSLAKDLGVSKQCISNWENDNVQPSVDMLMQLARYFHVSCDYMLGLSPLRSLDVSQLNESEVSHLSLIVRDLCEKRKKAYDAASVL